MLKITFEFKNIFSHGHWQKRECEVESVEECIKIYGLEVDDDIEYRIIKIEEI